jgi:hypothetical protein
MKHREIGQYLQKVGPPGHAALKSTTVLNGDNPPAFKDHERGVPTL